MSPLYYKTFPNRNASVYTEPVPDGWLGPVFRMFQGWPHVEHEILKTPRIGVHWRSNLPSLLLAQTMPPNANFPFALHKAQDDTRISPLDGVLVVPMPPTTPGEENEILPSMGIPDRDGASVEPETLRKKPPLLEPEVHSLPHASWDFHETRILPELLKDLLGLALPLFGREGSNPGLLPSLLFKPSTVIVQKALGSLQAF